MVFYHGDGEKTVAFGRIKKYLCFRKMRRKTDKNQRKKSPEKQKKKAVRGLPFVIDYV
jgi:hypothetical protein